MFSHRLLAATTSLLTMFGVAAIAPTSSLAAQVQLKADLGQSVLHVSDSGKVYLRLSLKTPVRQSDRERPPINVAIVIDRSGSMNGERIRAAKKAARVALDRLSSDDIVSLVSYNHDIQVLHRASRLKDARDDLDRAVERLTASGTTALYGGVEEGGEQVRKFLSDNKVNRVILLSDGLANVGPSRPADLARLGRKLASDGITVTTIGLGLDYNEDLMQRLAAASDGNHAFVEHPTDLAEIFDKEFGDALSVAARDIRIIIECKRGFSPTRVLGREAQISGNTISLTLNQLQAANERYIVVELDTPKSKAPGQYDVAEISVDYFDLDTSGRDAVSVPVKASVSDDAKQAQRSLNKSVMSKVTMQIATEKNEMAVQLRDKGKVSEARKMLESNAAYLETQRQALGSGAGAASEATLKELKRLESSNRSASANLDDESWKKTRKSMRYDQHRAKTQQAY